MTACPPPIRARAGRPGRQSLECVCVKSQGYKGANSKRKQQVPPHAHLPALAPRSQDGLGQTHTGQYQGPSHRLRMILPPWVRRGTVDRAQEASRFLPVASGKPRPHRGTGPPH